MEKVDATQRANVMYEMFEVIKDHNLTTEQCIFLYALICNIEYEASATDVLSLINKGLIDAKTRKPNLTLIFHLKTDVQLTLNLNPASKPNGTKFTLLLADKYEEMFVIDKHLDDDYRKKIADRYFKGDITIAKHYITFTSMFPTKSKVLNSKWNSKFGFIYDGTGLRDPELRVAKKFAEIYRKRDIGIFLEATFTRVRDSIDFESSRIFMTKPYKYMSSFESYYEEAEDDIKRKESRRGSSDPEQKLSLDL